MDAKSAVLKVGDGRGFVVTLDRYPSGDERRVVITAVHCLPKVPPAHPARYLEEYTYARLLGPLGGKRTVWAECLFADVMADIAVLGSPDNQELFDESEAYDQLVNAVTPLPVADAPKQGTELLTYGDQQISHLTPGQGPAGVLSLSGRWRAGEVTRRGGWLEFTPHKYFVGGMSGSPIIDANGAAIGVVSVDRSSPVIVDNLSARLVRSLAVNQHQQFHSEQQ
jgi:Trypsin-like peptidase domain